jgi:hypothetical protein
MKNQNKFFDVADNKKVDSQLKFAEKGDIYIEPTDICVNKLCVSA